MVAALAVGGCRREDVRTCDIEIRGLTTASAVQIKKAEAALGRYAGVRKGPYDWHMGGNGNLVLTLQYDSMQIAQTNLRMAIAETGAEVVCPTNASWRAGH